MKLTPEFLLALTAAMPMKQIDVNGTPYLQRYFAGNHINGDLWIHRFLSCDGDRHIHNHPWAGASYVLHGGYDEVCEVHGRDQSKARVVSNITQSAICSLIRGEIPEHYTHGAWIDPMTWHRIARVDPETWTLMVVSPGRLPLWWFREDDGRFSEVVSSPRDWWVGKTVRSLTHGAVQ